MTNLLEYKKVKKIKRVVKDLSEIEKLMGLIIQGLGAYKKYTPVKNVISSVLDNKAITNVYLKKFKRALEIESQKNKLE